MGVYGLYTPKEAREKAKKHLQRMDNGENPHPKVQPKREIITTQDLYRQYISGKKTPLAESSKYQYDSWMKNHFSDWLTLPAKNITGSMALDRLALMEKNSVKTQVASSIIPFGYGNGYDHSKVHDYLMLLFFTGLRKMEAAWLNWDDIDFRAKTFSFTPEKKRGEKPEDDRIIHATISTGIPTATKA